MEAMLELPETNNVEISPGIILIGKPTPRPDIGPTSMTCLADVNGALCLIELKLKFKEEK